MLNVAAHVPDYLPDHELGQLVAGLGNHEVKALLCVGMRPGVQYTGRDMAQEINDLQGSQPAWPIHPSNTTDYCRHSLEPAGLVRRVGGSAAIYVKTDYGSVVGDAVAGHLLDLSSRLPETALLNIFGKTGSTSSEGNIAAHNRIALYRYLLASSVPVRVSDALSRSYFGLASGHLHAMERDGLVTIETQNPRNDLVHYSVVDTERLQSLRLLSVSSDVREVVLAMHASDSSRMITTSAVIDELISRFPQYAELTKQDIKRKVSSKLRLFSSSGALEKVKVASTQSGRRHSDIYLTDDQRTILSDCLAVAQGIQALDKSFIDQGKKKAAAIVANHHLPGGNHLMIGQLKLQRLLKQNQV